MRPLTIRATVAITVFLLAVLPLLLFAHRFPHLAPFSMFAGDAFYYLDVASHSQATPFYSFDGFAPTNGFHPLWQFIIYSLMKAHFIDPNTPYAMLSRLFLLNIVILGLSNGLFTLFVMGRLRHTWIALLTVCPGWLWFLISPSAPDYLSNWSYANGMETSVELLLLSLALLSFRPKSPSQVWVPFYTSLLGLLVLARLDDIFFLVPMAVLVSKAPKVNRHVVIWSLGIPIIMVLCYLAYNERSTHLLLPISGTAKAAFALHQNLAELLKVLLPIRWDAPGSIGTIGYSVYAERFMRCFQLFVPALVCGLFLLRAKLKQYDVFWCLCVGVLLKSLYNLAFVPLWNQGSWYFGPSAIAANIVLSMSIDRIISSSFDSGVAAKKAWTLGFCSQALLAVLSFNVFINHKLSSGTGTRANLMLERRDDLAGMVKRTGFTRFIEFDDGVLSFATNLKSLSGVGLVLDQEAFAARRQGQFFDLAISRGYGLILSDGAYATALEQFSSMARAHPNANLFGIRSSEFLKYALKPVARDVGTDVRLYLLVRR